MKKIPIRKLLPNFIATPLWGNRKKWGLIIDNQDSDWLEWEKTYTDFYVENQRKGIGTYVNDAGYQIVKDLDFKNKKILEIGAGDIRHIKYWQNKPLEYILADISNDMMKLAKSKLDNNNVPYQSIKVERDKPLPLKDNSVDIVLSFYSLEHLYPFQPYLDEIKRVLKPNGILAGAIPAEGGLSWGLGRFLTSRRWFKKNTSIDPDKIICWEHPNFADEIIEGLNKGLTKRKLKLWPFSLIPILDLNLIVKFKYSKNL